MSEYKKMRKSDTVKGHLKICLGIEVSVYLDQLLLL